MKRIITTVTLVCLILSSMPIGNAEEDVVTWRERATEVSTITMEFDDPAITVQDGRSYIELGELPFVGTPLHPNVVFESMSLEFDTTFRVDHIDVKIGDITTMQLAAPVALNPEPVPIGLDSPLMGQFAAYDGKEYPDKWSDHRTGMGLNKDDDHTVFLVLFAYPVHVDDGIVRFTNEIVFTIHSHNEISKADGRGLTETYDLVIIGNTTFQSSIAQLVGHKESKGIKSKYVTLTEIYSGTYFTVQGSNNRERIKYFIKDAFENWGAENYLFFGDVSAIPPYYVPYVDPYTTSVPTDVYYGDIYTADGSFSNWTGTTGTSSTFTAPDDLYLDVKIGRMPVNTVSEADVVVDKIMHYENDTSKAWFLNAVLIGTDAFGSDEGELGMDKVDDIIGDVFTTTKLYHSQGMANAAQISPAIEAGAGIVTYAGHGMRGYLEINDTISYGKWHVNALTNGYMLPIGTQAACFTGEYDMAATDSYAENWVKKDGGGGIASMGAARAAYGWFGNGWTTRNAGKLNNRFYQALMDGHLTAGSLYSNARLYYLNERGLQDGMDFKTLIQFNWFADPSMMINGSVSATLDDPDLLIPGESNSVNLTFNNTGLAVNVTVDTDLSSLPGDWTAIVPDHFKVPGGDGQLSLNIIPAMDAEAGTTLDIPISIRFTDLNHSIFDGVAHLEVAHVHGLALTTDLPVGAVNVYPGDHLDVNITVNNTGNGPEDVALEMVDVFENWTSALDRTELDLLFKEEDISVLSIDIPHEQGPMQYVVKVRGTVVGQDLVREIDIPIKVVTVHGWNAQMSEIGIHADMGSNVSYNISFVNSGNILETIGIDGDLPTGWNITFPGQVDVDAYSSADVEVTVAVPDKAFHGDYPINLTVETIGQSVHLNQTINVNPSPAVNITVEAEVVELGFEEEGYALFFVENAGNTPLNITVKATMDGRDPPWSFDIPSEQLDILAWNLDSVKVAVMPPSQTDAGNYTMTFTVTALFDGQELTTHTNVTIIVRPHSDLTIDIVYDEFIMDPGKRITTLLEFNNSGNIPETISNYTFTLPDGWTAEVQTGMEHYTLDAFDENTIQQTIHIPEMAESKNYNFEIKVLAGGVVHSFPCKVFIRQLFGLEVVPEMRNLAVKKGETVMLKVNITNTGNGMDTFELSLIGDGIDWITLQKAEVELGPGEETTAILVVTPTKKTKAKDYPFTLQVKSDSGIMKSADLKVTVEKAPTVEPEGLSSTMIGVLALVIVLVIVFAMVGIILLRRKKGGNGGQGPPPEIPQNQHVQQGNEMTQADGQEGHQPTETEQGTYGNEGW